MTFELGLIIGIPIGAIAWAIGMMIADNMRRKHGAARCYHCGKIWDSED